MVYYQGICTRQDLRTAVDENPDKLDEYMSQMVDLQLLIHSQACPLLNKLKEKTIRSLNPWNSWTKAHVMSF